MPEMRVGQGFDVHPFSADPDRRLVLGGVVLAGPGLVGHSDSDPVAHACIDALLGAAGMGYIGERYPDTDPSYADIDSFGLLADTIAAVGAEGWQVVNLDCTVVLEAPRLAPHRVEIQDRLVAVIGAPVSVKAKRAESLGALGRGEGIAAMAVVLLERG